MPLEKFFCLVALEAFSRTSIRSRDKFMIVLCVSLALPVGQKAGKSSADGRVMSEQPDQIVAVASKSGRVDSLAAGIGYIRSNPYFSRLGRIQVSTGTLLLQQRSTRLS